RIRRAFPDDAIVGEEQGADRTGARRCWTIDPIDGTRGFISGFVQWGMLLALSVDGEPVLGVVHQPYTGETWTGSALGAEFLRAGQTRAIGVRACEALDAAVLATTDPFLFPEAEADAFDALRRGVRLTRYGGDCYAYCMLAMGQLDLVVESGLSPWDVRALVPLVEAAGGRITDWRGGDCSDGGQVLASGDARLHAIALDHLAAAATGSPS
ncbi:MAG: inositol monophosphatase family protein, partial [Pseudomonadales bacterium]|nr:inositol monophosphatase family protein [Pseudomonadales bacterium]